MDGLSYKQPTHTVKRTEGMAINKENIKLFESQRLIDEGDGGGRASGNVVSDEQRGRW